MSTNYKRWRMLFLFCLGLFAGTSICMKWMEGDFIWDGGKFTIIGLEIANKKSEVISILSGLDHQVKPILRYHLCFDFVFMVGVYSGIAALCMMAKEKSSSLLLKKVLLVLAILQAVAWACDIIENSFLLKWINNPVIGGEFLFYHVIVIAKWTIAMSGALIAIPLAIKKGKIR